MYSISLLPYHLTDSIDRVANETQNTQRECVCERARMALNRCIKFIKPYITAKQIY